MDGSHELAAALRESAGGVCITGGILGAVDARYAEVQEEENSGALTGAHDEKGRGGAGTYRHLSRNKMTTQVWIAILAGAAATIDDLARRHIANWIPAAALAGGFGWQIGQSGWHGAWNALGGTAAGFTAFLVFYLLGGMGGGDIKLMAGFGALLGPGQIFKAAPH